MFYERRVYCHAELHRREHGINARSCSKPSPTLLSASKKSVSASRELRIDINPKTGEIRALAKLLVVEEVTNPADENFRVESTADRSSTQPSAVKWKSK